MVNSYGKLIASTVSGTVLLFLHLVILGGLWFKSLFDQSNYSVSGWVALVFWSVGVIVTLSLIVFGCMAVLAYFRWLKPAVLLLISVILAGIMAIMVSYSPGLPIGITIFALSPAFMTFFFVYAFSLMTWWWIAKPSAEAN